MTDVVHRHPPHVVEPVTDEALAAVFTAARTANSFASTPVSDEELGRIWELARWAPTGANTQPLRVVFVRTDEGRTRLVEHLNDGNKAKTASAPAVAILACDNRFHEHLDTLLPFKPELRDLYEADEATRTATADLNTALQAGYFILAVRAVGLAAGPMSGFHAASLDADFFPDGRDGVRFSWSISATPARARGSPGFPGSRTPKPSGGNELPHHRTRRRTSATIPPRQQGSPS